MKKPRTASYTPEEDATLLQKYPRTQPSKRGEILPGRDRKSVEWRYLRLKRTASDRVRRGMECAVEPRRQAVDPGPRVAPIKISSIFALGTLIGHSHGASA